jgi:hypothetical protein
MSLFLERGELVILLVNWWASRDSEAEFGLSAGSVSLSSSHDYCLKEFVLKAKDFWTHWRSLGIHLKSRECFGGVELNDHRQVCSEKLTH